MPASSSLKFCQCKTGTLYEVNVRVERAIEQEYRAWLAAHVAEILLLPGFLSAQLYEIVTDASDAQLHFQLCVHYVLKDREALNHYLDAHAPRLRAQGVERFGNRFNATRRILVTPPQPPANAALSA
jgi:hypothetical protein